MSKLGQTDKLEIALGLFDHNMIKFGDFTLHSGIKSPMYCNLRNFVSYPEFAKQIARHYQTITSELVFDQIGAIPYGAIGVASAFSLEANIPWICARKESKNYGMGKDLIGEFETGQRILIVDDLVTTGGSKLESLVSFESSGLVVEDFAVILDYNRGATKLLEDKGYSLHRMMLVEEVIQILRDQGRIDQDTYDRVMGFLTI
ncbi:orotate phosphoribosyltransferase [Candidatus Saccharibacteria bacterium]|nr:orotate phosphoribosyltransferase [Candidatus Saccharibacteria bacterium]MCB9834439.1 orotate phosphoribosyltransferase [Candidatus Nomurabacteria bacterium]